MSDVAISLMKCILDILLPTTFVLLNLFILVRYFQSQRLLVSCFSCGWSLQLTRCYPYRP